VQEVSEFKREARYMVFKLTDLDVYLDPSTAFNLRQIGSVISKIRASYGKPALECVVVESDWPEYEPTWRAIERRMTGVVKISAEDAVLLEKTLDDFLHVGETDTPYSDLMRFANMGLLECMHFVASDLAEDAIAAARSAKGDAQ
jgi:hypothetical protein